MSSSEQPRSPAYLAAKAAGKKRFLGPPCNGGHRGERYVSSGECCECRDLRARGPKEARAKKRGLAAIAPPATGSPDGFIAPIPRARLMARR